MVPTTRLFFPDPDPTEKYPKQTVTVEGYVVAPDRLVTVAVVAPRQEGIDVVDSIWEVLRRKGVGVRHLTVLNDRGGLVSLLTLRVDASSETLQLLQSLLLVPMRIRDGEAEVHLLATPSDFAALKGRIASDGLADGSIGLRPATPVEDTGVLIPRDWAFLGLLSSVGAFDGPEGPRPALLAEALGIDPEVFAEHVRSVEHGLHGLVRDLFAPVDRIPARQGWPT
jgi:predicted DNA binding protein